MARSEAAPRPDPPAQEVGLYRAFDRWGNVIWECPGFVAGRSKVPAGFSVVMAAMTITGPRGKVLRKWDPWGALELARKLAAE
ncbi:MAG TPA: hypothetical protein VMW08_00375 [Acidimicrobiales bacterium]|nr:hypothetical protein [Acidimicrobiales bacterium]